LWKSKSLEEFYWKTIRPEGDLVAVAYSHRLGIEPAQQRAVLRHKFDVPALGALEHDIPPGGAIGQEGEFGEDVTIEFVVAAQALHSAYARGRFLIRGRFIDRHFLEVVDTIFSSNDSTAT
jgi:hypothetical protein